MVKLKKNDFLLNIETKSREIPAFIIYNFKLSHKKNTLLSDLISNNLFYNPQRKKH